MLQCRPGYEIQVIDGKHLACINLEECVTQGGNAHCTGNGNSGICEDGFEKFTCECSPGHEVQTHPEHAARIVHVVPLHARH